MGRRRKILPFHTLITEGYGRKIKVKSGGRSKKISKQEVIVFQQVMKAVKRDRKAIRYIIRNFEEGVGIKRRRDIGGFAGPDGMELYYGNGMIQRTHPDGRVEWAKRDVGGKEELIPNPSKAQIRRWEEED